MEFQRVMTKAELDEVPIGELLDIPNNVQIEDFNKEDWRSAWFECVEVWWEDGEAMYFVMRDGFLGFLHRSDFDIYCDIRFTHDITDQAGWDEVAVSAEDLGKYS